MTKTDQYIHETRDGRVIPLSEVAARHLFATVTKLTNWLKAEADPDL